MSVNLGRVAYVEKGAYDGGTVYQKKDVVFFNNGSFVFIADAPAAGIVPTDSAYWQPMLDPTFMNQAAVTANQAAETANQAANAANTAAEAADNARLAIAEELNKKAPAIFVDASGEMVHITDGAAMPVQSLVTHIAPVQSGSGDPSPDNVRPISGWDSVRVANDTSSQTITQTLPETVYGGTLNWTTGVLTVTHKKETITRMSATHSNAGEGYLAASVSKPDMKSDSRDNGLCETMKSVRSQVGATSNCIVFGASNQTLYIAISTELAGTTRDSLNAYLAENPLTVVYPLAEPYTIQLTPGQMDMLKGENIIRSNTGKTDVTYMADTKMYVDMRLAALAAALYEPMPVCAEDTVPVCAEELLPGMDEAAV